MWEKVVNTVITFVISGSLGYCVSAIKNYKKKILEKRENESVQNKALLTLLRNNLVNTYFDYNKKKQIPDYIYQSFLAELEVYEALGGDGFVHTIAKKMDNWELIKTDILQKDE